MVSNVKEFLIQWTDGCDTSKLMATFTIIPPEKYTWCSKKFDKRIARYTKFKLANGLNTALLHRKQIRRYCYTINNFREKCREIEWGSHDCLKLWRKWSLDYMFSNQHRLMSKWDSNLQHWRPSDLNDLNNSASGPSRKKCMDQDTNNSMFWVHLQKSLKGSEKKKLSAEQT